MPNGQEGNNFVRKHKDLPGVEFQNLKSDWEKRVIFDKTGEIKEVFDKYEMKIGPQQREVLEFVVHEVNEFFDSCALRNPHISLDAFKFVRSGFFEEFGSSDFKATFFANMQTIVIDGEYNISNTDLAGTAFHECMHMLSFQRNVLIGDRDDGYANIKPERSGLSVYSSKNPMYQYFNFINEAVTVELENRFCKKMEKIKLFQEDILKIKKKYGSDFVFSFIQMKKDEKGNLDPERAVSYSNEYKKTKEMMQNIYEKNKDEFNSVDEVMELFIEAYFTGKLLPIARLLEKTYGKGKFRAIGEESA